MKISEIQQEIVEEFEFFEDWEQKYEYLIEQGKSIPIIHENHKTDENLINGCQSKVWLFAEKKDDKVIYYADSDAILTKGLVALLLRVYSNQTSNDILDSNNEFLHQIGLKEHLSPTRANGLVAMTKMIKMYALAFKGI